MRLVLIAIAAAAFAAPAIAQENGDAEARPEALSRLLGCRALTAEAERLACYDREVAAFEQAETARDIVVVDRQQVRETRRRLFGFALPDLRLFGGRRDREEAREEEEREAVREVQSTVVAASGGNGSWTVTLEDGAIWTQIDNRPLGIWPRRGSSVLIRRGPLGNYMMRVEGQAGIRVRRVG